MIRSRRLIVGKSAFWILLFVISFLIYYINCVNDLAFYNSDNAYYALAGKDILRGNVFLKGWYGSTNSFYLLSIIYGVLGAIFGYSVNLLYIGSAFLWAAATVIVTYIVGELNSDGSRYEKYVKYALTFAMLFSSCYFMQDYKMPASSEVRKKGSCNKRS